MVSQDKQKAETSGAGRLLGWVVTVVLIIAMAGSFFYVNHYGTYDREYMSHAAAIRVLSQQVAKNAAEAANGNVDAFHLLKKTQKQLQGHLGLLQNGISSAKDIPAMLMEEIKRTEKETGKKFQLVKIPPSKEYGVGVKEALNNVETPWNKMTKNVDFISQNKEAVIAAKELTDKMKSSAAKIQEQVDKLIKNLVKSGASASQVYIASQLSLAAEQIPKNMIEMTASQIGNITASEQLEKAIKDFKDALGSLRSGANKVTDTGGRRALRDINKIFSGNEGVEKKITDMLAKKQDLFNVRRNADEIFSKSDQLLAATTWLVNEYRKAESGRLVQEWYGLAFGAATLIMLFFMGIYSRRESQKRLAITEAEKRIADEDAERNQQAILELLDEIQGLSEGDLTSHASVGEAFTGAIADAFNSAIDALRQLVMTINNTSVQVSSAAQQAQATAMHLAEASDHQAHQITAASAAINEMAVSIDQVSKNSEESTNVAQKSVDLALKGADMVRKTISGMDSIREQIQETSKRIKRLGESSQEIGNIVELINDIADQTNILALNASIQAAMAGESGRGFAVVADEVQRLAERSSNATKQIEALVKTIQTDTNEAVISMEQSTSGVVAGAKQAETSGESLREIEGVSTHLANLIQNISEAARQQANAAANISDTMNVIQEITSQTSAGTNETATSIGNLADLANDLRGSVAGFKLPE